jgi:hypothetical protein
LAIPAIPNEPKFRNAFQMLFQVREELFCRSARAKEWIVFLVEWERKLAA